MNKKKTTTIAVLAVILVLGFFGWQMWRGESTDGGAEQDDAALQAEASKLNPFAAQEPANPFEETANPYENIKVNPFE